jgi:hypothetical protein
VKNLNIFLISGLAFLTGCGHLPGNSVPEIQIVQVPVSLPCKQSIPATPSFNFDLLKEQDPLFEKARALLADRKLHLAYESELLAALQACVKE